jgi:predicted O-methyltransferase YrrM
MNDQTLARIPVSVPAILSETEALNFNMVSEPKVGALLATLAASKPGGRFLELGTGTGHGTAWLLSGMDSASRLDSVDTERMFVSVADRFLGADPRVSFHVMDGAEFINRAPAGSFDLIYADAWPGKFSHLDEALALLRPGGMYVIDDLLPQPNWPEGHAPKVPALIERLEQRADVVTVKLAWASGLMIVVRPGAASREAEEDVVQSSNIASRFVGAWRLLSCETRNSKGQMQFPFGEKPKGQLVYDASGNVSAQLMKTERTRFASRDPALGTDAEVRDAFDGYIGYYGTYSVDDSTRAVTHYVHGASFPNWTGANLVRSYTFDENGRLRLSTPPIEVGGESLEYTLWWERMS